MDGFVRTRGAMEKNHDTPKTSPRKPAARNSGSPSPSTPSHTTKSPSKHISGTKNSAKQISATRSPAKQIPSTKSQSRHIPATNSRPQRIPSRPRPQSQCAYSCPQPQPRYVQCWPWSQHYGKDTWPWERETKVNSSPKKRQLRASSDTAATCRMTSSMYATERPSSSHVYEGGVFGPSSHGHKRDFFVIHPDWVSEADTVKKLTHTERKPRQIIISRPARRCRSAPPPRNRNPITWED